MSETCCLCRIQIDDTFCTGYNLDGNITKYTNKLLRIYLMEILHNQISFADDNLICTNCMKLLDDLDYAETCFKKIKSVIWNYLGYNQISPNKSDVYCQTDNLNDTQSIVKQEDNYKQTYEYVCLKTFISNDTNYCKENVETKECIESSNISTQFADTNNEEHPKQRKLKGVLKPYQCTMCSKTWKTLGELKSHISSHSNVRPFICEICGQSYKQKSALAIHVGMHNGVYPFTCMYCKKSFTQKGALQRHLPIHTGDTPYQCDVCGKRFVHHTSFNIHKLSHTGQKDYKCPQCGLALLSGSHLKRHMRVHTGERKYACNLCDKRFAERYNLASHQKLHEKTADTTAYKRNHRCSLCVQTFNRRLKLDEHMVQEHQKIV